MLKSLLCTILSLFCAPLAIVIKEHDISQDFYKSLIFAGGAWIAKFFFSASYSTIALLLCIAFIHAVWVMFFKYGTLKRATKKSESATLKNIGN